MPLLLLKVPAEIMSISEGVRAAAVERLTASGNYSNYEWHPENPHWKQSEDAAGSKSQVHGFMRAWADVQQKLHVRHGGQSAVEASVPSDLNLNTKSRTAAHSTIDRGSFSEFEVPGSNIR